MNESHDKESWERIVEGMCHSTLFGFVPLSKEDSDWFDAPSLEKVMIKSNQQDG